MLFTVFTAGSTPGSVSTHDLRLDYSGLDTCGGSSTSVGLIGWNVALRVGTCAGVCGVCE